MNNWFDGSFFGLMMLIKGWWERFNDVDFNIDLRESHIFILRVIDPRYLGRIEDLKCLEHLLGYWKDIRKWLLVPDNCGDFRNIIHTQYGVIVFNFILEISHLFRIEDEFRRRLSLIKLKIQIILKRSRFIWSSSLFPWE